MHIFKGKLLKPPLHKFCSVFKTYKTPRIVHYGEFSRGEIFGFSRFIDWKTYFPMFGIN